MTTWTTTAKQSGHTIDMVMMANGQFGIRLVPDGMPDVMNGEGEIDDEAVQAYVDLPQAVLTPDELDVLALRICEMRFCVHPHNVERLLDQLGGPDLSERHSTRLAEAVVAGSARS